MTPLASDLEPVAFVPLLQQIPTSGFALPSLAALCLAATALFV